MVCSLSSLVSCLARSRCWYYKKSQATFALVGINPAYHTRPKQNMNSEFGCPWRVNVALREDGRWYINGSHTQHCGHPPVDPALVNQLADGPFATSCGETPPRDKTILDSMEGLPMDVAEFVKEKLIDSTPTSSIRRRVIDKFGPKYGWSAIATETWRNILKKLRDECGLSNDDEQVSHLIAFIQQTKMMSNPFSLGGSIEWSFKSDEDGRCECLFFMNDIMKENFRRCGQFLVMDTTAKTNCFGMYLIIISVLDQDRKCAMVSTGLIRRESIDSFSWFIEQTRAELIKSFGQASWDSVSAICTDGDPGFTSVIKKLLPKAHHMRCIYHIQENILKGAKAGERPKLTNDLYRLRRIDDQSQWPNQWDDFLSGYESTKNIFTQSEGADGQMRNMPNKRRVYLENQLEKIKESWVLAWINGRTTFGYMATTLGESVNAVVKKTVSNGSNLVTVFQSIHRLTIDAHQQSIHLMTRQREKILTSSTSASKGKTLPQDLSFQQHLLLHLTGAAAKVVEEQYQFVDNWQAKLITTDAVAAAADSNADEQENEEPIFIVSVTENQFMRLTSSSSSSSSSPRAPKERTVRVSSTFMQCDCHHPTTHLLPCSHVLAANRLVLGYPFQVNQIHTRWKVQTIMEADVQQSNKFTNRVVDLCDAQYLSFVSFLSTFFPSDSPPISKEMFHQKMAEYRDRIPETSESKFNQLSRSWSSVSSGVANTPSEAAKFPILMILSDLIEDSFTKGENIVLMGQLPQKRNSDHDHDEVKCNCSPVSDNCSDPLKPRRSGRLLQRRLGARKSKRKKVAAAKN